MEEGGTAKKPYLRERRCVRIGIHCPSQDPVQQLVALLGAWVERRAGAGLRRGAVRPALLPELVPVARPDARSASPPLPLPRGVETKGARRAEPSLGERGGASGGVALCAR